VGGGGGEKNELGFTNVLGSRGRKKIRTSEGKSLGWSVLANLRETNSEGQRKEGKLNSERTAREKTNPGDIWQGNKRRIRALLRGRAWRRGAALCSKGE